MHANHATYPTYLLPERYFPDPPPCAKTACFEPFLHPRIVSILSRVSA